MDLTGFEPPPEVTRLVQAGLARLHGAVPITRQRQYHHRLRNRSPEPADIRGPALRAWEEYPGGGRACSAGGSADPEVLRDRRCQPERDPGGTQRRTHGVWRRRQGRSPEHRGRGERHADHSIRRSRSFTRPSRTGPATSISSPSSTSSKSATAWTARFTRWRRRLATWRCRSFPASRSWPISTSPSAACRRMGASRRPSPGDRSTSVSRRCRRNLARASCCACWTARRST